MTDQKLKSGWKIWRFDQMAVNVNDRIDNPSDADVEHYVGLEHLDPESLKIRRWGTPSDVEATKLCFRKGDIIFGRRRAYQRKLAVADFDGICSAHAMVLRAKPEVVLSEFLPFFMQSDLFMNRAMEISVGSLSPTINWKTLAAQEFALPPLEDQQRVIDVFHAVDSMINEVSSTITSTQNLRNSQLKAFFGDYVSPDEAWPNLSECCQKIGDGTHIPPKFTDSGIPFLLVSNIGSGKLSTDFSKWISTDSYTELTKSFRPSTGDILYSLVGSYGIPVYVDWEWPFSFQRHIGVIRTEETVLRGKFLYFFLNSLPAIWQSNRFAEGLAQKTITLKSLRSFQVPLPDLATQNKIVEELSATDNAIEGLQDRLTQAVTLKKIMLQSILQGYA